MASLNRLVAATDLSAPARHAVERAASVARVTGAQLDLVHVTTPAPLQRLRRLAGQIPSDLEQLMLDAPRNALQELADSMAQRHSVATQVHVAHGALLPELQGYTDAARPTWWCWARGARASCGTCCWAPPQNAW